MTAYSYSASDHVQKIFLDILFFFPENSKKTPNTQQDKCMSGLNGFLSQILFISY